MIQAFYGHAERLSAHPFGCRVIQRVLENNNMTELKAPLLEEIINCADKLSQGAISPYLNDSFSYLNDSFPTKTTNFLLKPLLFC